MFYANLTPNEQWVAALNKVSDELFQKQIQAHADQLMQQQKQFQQIAQRYVDSSKPSYSSSIQSRSESNSRVMDGWTNVITDREYYDTSDGGQVKLDSSYSYTYSNGNDFVQSNNALDLPSGWDRVSGSTMWR